MKCDGKNGLSLVELLIAMAIASITGSMIMHMVISFQANILKEISRNDLHDRAERLMRFIAHDISESSFLLGSVPQVADGTSLILTHDSQPGDPAEEFPFSILPEDIASGDDRLTFVKAESFCPPIRLQQPALSGDTLLLLDRRPNRSPGSSRELWPAPEAINHLVLASHKRCYEVLEAEQDLELVQPLIESVPPGTEVLGVRAYTYYLDPFSGSKRLRRDDFTSRTILDDAVDGLQFEYLLKDGSLVSQPVEFQDIRGIRINLLVRDLRLDREYKSEQVFSLGNQTYGPFRDHFRRELVTRIVEVKNNAIQ